jgi:hypothetical protein
MIERDHAHALRPISTRDLPDGRTIINSRCQGGCGLEEQRVIQDETVVKLRLRLNGIWIEPLDLLRITKALPYVECGICLGERGLTVCPACADIGLTALDGERLEIPNLRINA